MCKAAPHTEHRSKENVEKEVFFRVWSEDPYVWAQRVSLVFALARKENCSVPVRQLSAALPLGADEQ